jgi:hypothetical protein
MQFDPTTSVPAAQSDFGQRGGASRAVVLTKSDQVRRHQYFGKLTEIFHNLQKTGTADKLTGNCVAACDILQNLLMQVGIPTRLVEVQLTIMTRRGENQDFSFIGFDNLSFPGQVDTHVILVTEDTAPLLIDPSIAHVLDPEHPFIVEALNSSSIDKIAEFELRSPEATRVLTYQRKKSVRLPALHQKTLLARVLDEQKSENMLVLVKWLSIAGLALGAINFCANAVLLALKIIFP